MSNDYTSNSVPIDWGDLTVPTMPGNANTAITISPSYNDIVMPDNASLTIGDVTIKAEDLRNIKYLLEAINDLPDDNEFKQFINTKKMFSKLKG